MSQLIRRLLSLLFTLNFFKAHYIITYTGKVVSTNTFYSSPHWAVRQKLKNQFTSEFSKLLKTSQIKKIDKFSLLVFCNTRIDIDNHGVQNKFLIDVLRKGYVEDDTTKYYQSTHTVHDPKLPRGTVEYHLLCY